MDSTYIYTKAIVGLVSFAGYILIEKFYPGYNQKNHRNFIHWVHTFLVAFAFAGIEVITKQLFMKINIHNEIYPSIVAALIIILTSGSFYPKEKSKEEKENTEQWMWK